jgi:uncharacterized protein YgfB (UPF0149 family)
MQDPIGYERLDEALARIGYVDAAAEYHGTLCGSLSVKAPAEINTLQLLNSGERPPLHADSQSAATLSQLRQQALASLQDSDMAFQPLLPDDETALVPRVRALVSWCEGFLYGLASKPGLDLQRCSEELREIVQDFTEFTRAAVGDEDPDIEETAYTELFEYVRVGAQLIFMELHPRPTLDPNQPQQLH